MWAVDLDARLGRVAEYRGQLSPDEIQRADRFRFEVHAARFTIGRATLRRLLGEKLGLDPRAVAFAYGPRGKPALAGPELPSFNVAHCGGLALIAISTGAPIGVDIERLRPLTDMPALMRASFAPAERSAIEALPAEQQLQAFFRCWTRREAVLKALGAGLTEALDALAVSVHAEDPTLLQMDGEDDVRRWTLRNVNPAVGYVGALACRDESEMPRTWTYAG